MTMRIPILIDRKAAGVVSFVSYDRLVNESIKEAIGLRENERIIGILPETFGITVYVEMVK